MFTEKRDCYPAKVIRGTTLHSGGDFYEYDDFLIGHCDNCGTEVFSIRKAILYDDYICKNFYDKLHEFNHVLDRNDFDLEITLLCSFCKQFANDFSKIEKYPSKKESRCVKILNHDSYILSYDPIIFTKTFSQYLDATDYLTVF